MIYVAFNTFSAEIKIPTIFFMEHFNEGNESSDPNVTNDGTSPSNPQNNGEGNDNTGGTNDSSTSSNPQNNSENDQSNVNTYRYADRPLHRSDEEMAKDFPPEGTRAHSEADLFQGIDPIIVSGDNNVKSFNTEEFPEQNEINEAYIKGNNNNVTLGEYDKEHIGIAYIHGDNNTVHCGTYSPVVQGNNNNIILSPGQKADLAGNNNHLEGGTTNPEFVTGQNNVQVNASSDDTESGSE